MSKNKILYIAAIWLILVSDSLAIANSSDTTSTNLPATTPSSPKTSCPKQILGVTTGIIVGTPVNMIRRPIDEEKYGINQIDKENHQPRVVIPSLIFWAPFSVVIGIMEAPFFALNNSLVNHNKSFSKEQFSLDGIKSLSRKAPIHGTTER